MAVLRAPCSCSMVRRAPGQLLLLLLGSVLACSCYATDAVDCAELGFADSLECATCDKISAHVPSKHGGSSSAATVQTGLTCLFTLNLQTSFRSAILAARGQMLLRRPLSMLSSVCARESSGTFRKCTCVL